MGYLHRFLITLAKVKAHLAKRLQVVLPVDRIGNYIFGRGCKAHACGEDEAA